MEYSYDAFIDDVLAVFHRYAQKMVLAELKQLEALPNVYPEKIGREFTHVQAIYKSAITARISSIEKELEEL